MSHQKEREEAMNYDHPPLLEKLAAEYVLGTMSMRVRRRFTQHLHNSYAAQRAVAHWHQNLTPLHTAIAPIEPQASVWKAISRKTKPAAAGKSWAERLRELVAGSMKPALGLCFGAILTLGLVHQTPQIIGLEPASETLAASYVGVLADTNGDAALAVSSLRHGTIVSLKMFKPLAVPAQHVAVLWALPAGAPPLRLGIVAASGKSQIILSAPAEKVFAKISKLAVSIEANPQATAPSGPFVIKGNCVKIW
jgi:anti-sigma-K factor RskA